MTVKTSIPENSSDAQYDEYAKNITEHRWVLAQIVRHVLPELEGRSVEEVMGMICSDVQVRVPFEPGQTNAPAADPDGHVLGLNTEDKVPNEGSVVFDFVFRMQLPGRDEPSLVAVMVDLELMRQLSSKYDLGDRKQVYACRSVSSQVGRTITHQQYSDALPVISIWLCFNRPVNTFCHGSFVEESSSDVDENTGRQIRDRRLEAKRSLQHVYTIGFRNDPPKENEQAHRELFELLTALYSATILKEDKLRTLHEHFGLRDLESSQQSAIEEDIGMMDTIEAVMRRDFARQLAEKDSALAQQKDALAQRDIALAQQKDALAQRDTALAERDTALAEKDKLIAELQRALGQKD